jgi:hypothetical protein
MKDKCTLSNEELIQACRDWVRSLARTGGNSWVLQVPVNFDRDPDMLFCELINRFRELRPDTPTPDLADIERQQFLDKVIGLEAENESLKKLLQESHKRNTAHNI